MTMFHYRQSGTTGCELLDPDGRVVAWTVDAGWAGIIVGLLNGAGCPRPAEGHQGKGGQVKETTMSKQEVRELVKTLLLARPDLVIVKTTSQEEKRTLVKLLRSAGATVICREG